MDCESSHTVPLQMRASFLQEIYLSSGLSMFSFLPGPTQRTTQAPPGGLVEERKPQTLMRGIAVALVLAVTGSVAFTVPSHAQVAARRAAVLLPRALPTAC